MPDAVPQSPLLHRMWFTPVSDALRGRLTGRLDVEGRMERAGLPAPARELIRRVVRRTSLWRVERANVADELIAHFADGLEGGQAVDELIASFGDERRAAKLIRRAKRRNRPLPWHAMVFLRRLVGALVVFYLLLTAWFYSGRPSPAVDRLAELNARVAQVPEDQRAWPLYRDAIIAAGLQPSAGAARADGAMLTARPGDARWDQMAGWLGRNSAGLEPARRAHEKPVLGLPVARQGQDTDPALRPPWPQSVRADRRAVDPSEAHVVALWRLADALAADAHAAADRGDVDLALRDVIAILGIARHMRDGSQAVGWHNDNVALGRRDTALEAAQYLLTRATHRMTPADLRRLAHALAEPDAARDLVSVDRVAAHDALRLVYSDNGDGGGRLTPQGMAELSPSGSLFVPEALPNAASWVVPDPAWLRKAVARAAAPALPFLLASRRDATEALDRALDLAEANLNKPIWQADWAAYHQLIREWTCSGPNRLRYAAVEFPPTSSDHEHAERHLGERDGLLVAVALEAYRREHDGRLPATLDALVPALLPHVPPDRMTGNPVRYRVVDGTPVVYSVGNDHDDDGGRAALGPDGKPAAWVAGTWPRGREKPVDGDWVLYRAGGLRRQGE